MKKKIVILLVVATILIFSVSALTVNTMNTCKLSELSDAELVSFVQSMGVNIPDEFRTRADLGEIIRLFVQHTENNPNHLVSYNYSVTHQFASDVKAAVNSYYTSLNISLTDPGNSTMAIIQRALQQNSVIGSWSSSYSSYDCYGYALGRNRDVNPGTYYNESALPGMGYKFTLDLSIDGMATVVLMDLQALGYGADCYPTRPSYSSIAPDETLICIRKDETTNLDYHFMRSDPEDQSWKHKPSTTNPLQFLPTPSNSVDWIHEYSYNNVCYYDDSFVYDSSVRYIVFGPPDYSEEDNNSIPDIPEVDVVS